MNYGITLIFENADVPFFQNTYFSPKQYGNIQFEFQPISDNMRNRIALDTTMMEKSLG